MPNWCNNTLTVSGKKEDLQKFSEEVKDSYTTETGQKIETALSLNKIIPMPEALKGTIAPPSLRDKELIAKYGADNWYDWCHINWGVKWDVTGELNYQEDESLCYIFDSAWSPPTKAIVKMSEKYPSLDFSLDYEETGMMFRGSLTVIEGEIVEDFEEDIESFYCEKCKEDSYKDVDGLCGMCGE